MQEGNEIPQPDWATWALLKEANKPDPQTKALFLCRDRLEAITDDPWRETKRKQAFIVATNTQYWGRGKTLEEAAVECRKAGAGRFDEAVVTVVLNDDEPYVNGMGAVCYKAVGESIVIGSVGPLKGMLPKKRK